MMTFHVDDTVDAIVRDRPAISRLFEQFQVDYCCGGQKTLAEACAKRGIDPQAFLTELENWTTTAPVAEWHYETAAVQSLTQYSSHSTCFET
jgi:regulator of cell morphogenesis and NO signaling